MFKSDIAERIAKDKFSLKKQEKHNLGVLNGKCCFLCLIESNSQNDKSK
jgi:hypothetical protein